MKTRDKKNWKDSPRHQIIFNVFTDLKISIEIAFFLLTWKWKLIYFITSYNATSSL